MKLRSLFPRSRLLLLCGLVAGSLLLSGCMLFPQSRSQKSGSVVAFLFPKEKPQVQAPSIPVLQLPLRVGLAFVPEADTATAGSFTEMQKQTLLKKTADQFRAQPFVQSIQVVPGAYLRAGGSFDNLDQLRSLLGIDVIVLLSYDQVQFTEDNVFSLAYWTIVGAYFFNGNRNDTHTLVEAVVYDIASRSLLFRAPGVDQTKASTGAAYVERELRKDSGESFDRAIADTSKNLESALHEFRENVKAGRSEVKVVARPGYTGGGAIDGRTLAVMLVVFLAASALYARKHMGRRRRKDKRP
jgi:rhombotail lipoprotein